MTERKWTPGPWAVINNSRHETYHIGPIDMWDNEKDSAAEVPYSHPIRSVESANARLISAAPDMYEALKASLGDLLCVRDYIDDASRGQLRYRGASDISEMAGADLVRIDETIASARAALAKAEGRET